MTWTSAADRAAFAVLGLPTDATRIEIAQAYRRLARATHPDLSGEADAEERFAAISAAYEQATATVPEVPDAPPVRGVSPSPGRTWRGARSSVPHAGVVAGPVHVSPLPPPPSPPSSPDRER